VIIGDIEPVPGFWVKFEKKILFTDEKFQLAKDKTQIDKQINLILYCFIVAKITAARFLLASQAPHLFEGIPSAEHPYLRLCGLTCITLLTDIVCDLFREDLA